MIVTDSSTYQDHFERFQQDVSADQPTWLAERRRVALERFLQLGFPTTKQEDWRFTNISPLTAIDFDQPPSAHSKSAAALAAAAELGDDCHRLVFINGQFASELSRISDLEREVRIVPLAHELNADQPALAERWDAAVRTEPSTFGDLNTAFFRDGVVIEVGSEVQVAKPVHVIFVTDHDDSPVVSSPKSRIELAAGASLCLIESHVGAADQVYLSNSVMEIQVAQQARLDHYKLQRESTAAFHLGSTHVVQQANSWYSNHYFGLGGAIARNKINAYHDGESVETTLNGLYMVSGEQLADCRTRIDHAQPNCESHEVYKGILDGHARGVFNGKIHVHQDAQKTDAKQSNQALLLSDDAVIDTKPELEIYADDVRCTHGATVGELGETALFYLRSRGIPEPLARKMLVFAFANDVVQGIEFEPLRRSLEAVLLADHGLPYV